jgi:hypothetical protein
MPTETKSTLLDKLPLDFFLHYPLKYYCQSLFTPSDKHIGGVFIGPERTSAMILEDADEGKLLVYNPSIETMPGAPNASKDTNPGGGKSEFIEKILIANKAHRNAPQAVVLDFTKTYINLFTFNQGESDLETIRQKLTESPKNILQNWNDPETYLWEVIDPTTFTNQPKDGEKNTNALLIGIAKSAIDLIVKSYADSDAILTTIMPLQLATAQWFIERFPDAAAPAFLLISRPTHLSMMFIQKKTILHYKTLRNGPDQSQANANEIQHDVDEICTEHGLDNSTPIFVFGADEGYRKTGVSIIKRFWPECRPIGLDECAANTPIRGHNGDLKEEAYLLNWAIRKALKKPEENKPATSQKSP